MAGSSVASSQYSLFTPLLFIEQYGPATTGELADDQRLPLLAMRGHMKSMAALGFVEEVGYRWHLTSCPREPETITQSLHTIMKKHEGKWTHQIARSAGLDVIFLKSWLKSEGKSFFKEDRFNRWYPVAANENDQAEYAVQEDVQVSFITSPLDRDLVVMAPPGTGKTHALVQRLGWMSRQCPEPRQMASICVLSFTNNAVNEIVSRLGEMAQRDDSSDSVRYINIRTFDSFATRCLVDSGLPVTGNFEQNIISFTECLTSGFKNSNVIPQLLGSIRWLFVDEIQDLSGERAEMVFALAAFLKRGNVYFAFLGDRHQGIYNHSAESVEVQSFIPLQQEILKGREPLRFNFKKSYRYHDQVFARFMEQARAILDVKESSLKQFQSLEKVVPTLIQEELNDWIGGGQVAILAGRNETVARVASFMDEGGISFTIEDGASAGSEWPLWVWQIFHSWQQPFMSRHVFSIKAAALGCAETLYGELQYQGLANNDFVDVGRLANSVFDKPWRRSVLKSTEKQGVILSTIHKSKGMQYDKVLVITDDCRFAKEDQARLLYVAMTRAKKELRGITSKALCTQSKGYFAKGMEHYYLDSLSAFYASDLVELKGTLNTLTMLAGELLPKFMITQDSDHSWLCILDEANNWHRLIRWYFQKNTFIPKDTLLTPSRWTTIAWPDDGAVFRKLLGPQLLLPLPVFTHGQ